MAEEVAVNALDGEDACWVADDEVSASESPDGEVSL